MSGKQHVELFRKLALRRTLLRALGKPKPGEQRAAYVPFIGDGDIAAELYGDMTVYGADLDPGRVQLAQSRVTGQVKVHDCDRWPFPGLDQPLTVGDFDAYHYPYDSFRAAWSSAQWADKVAVFFTDGMKRAVQSGAWREPDGTKINNRGQEGRHLTAVRRTAYNMWLTSKCHPWLKDAAAARGYRVGRKMAYQRGHMVYWGAILARPAPATRTPVRALPALSSGRRPLPDLVVQGNYAAAPQGFTSPLPPLYCPAAPQGFTSPLPKPPRNRA